MKLSIVTTLYYSEAYVHEFYQRITSAAQHITSDYEIIFVNDGSPDKSLDLASGIMDDDKKVKIINLTRNFGHHKAIMMGLEHSSGEVIFLIDSDLEESTEWLLLFNEKMVNGVDSVIGVQKKRQGSFLKRLGGNLFYNVLKILSNRHIPEGMTVARLMSRKYVQSLLAHKENEIFFAGLCSITGYNQVFVPVDKPYKGKTSYSFTKRLKQAVNAVVSFSNKPLYLLFILGCTVFIISGVYILLLIFQKIFYSMQIGFASIIASICFMGGTSIMCSGVIGIYLAKIYEEVKKRPTLIKELLGDFGDKDGRI